MESQNIMIGMTLFESPDYRNILAREDEIGADQLFEELIQESILTNPQMMWLLKYMLYHYGGKDKALLAAPPERLLENMGNLLRVNYLLIDSLNPELDENTRLYISTKLKQSTWGLSTNIRQYLNRSNP